MAITSAMSTSFKVELLKGLHNFTTTTGGAFKLALIKATPVGTFGAASTNYSELSTDEASGTGYTAGGIALTNVTPVSSGTTAYADFADVSWTTATISADGCMIYNTSNANSSVQVHDFGGTKTSTGGTFAITFPTADATNAITRLA